MRPLLPIIFGGLFFMTGVARAQSPTEKAWIELMEMCSTVIQDQSDVAMKAFPATTPLHNFDPLIQRTVRHPDASIIANAVAEGPEWFLCLVEGDPPVKTAENRQLVEKIAEALAQQIKQEHDYAIEMKSSFSPVRLTCHARDRITATFAAENDEGELRVAATKSLLPNTANPCLNNS